MILSSETKKEKDSEIAESDSAKSAEDFSELNINVHYPVANTVNSICIQ